VAAPDGRRLRVAFGSDWDVSVAECSLDALRLASNDLALVVVSDDLPEGGHGMLRALRHRIGPDVPAIFVGSSWDAAFVETAIAAGAADIVVSPAPGELVARALLALHGRRAEHAGLMALAYTDELTGLPNRRYLADKLNSAIKNAHFRIEPLSILLLDIDKFKQINDRFGHHAGDRVLIEFAKVLRAGSRSSDVIGRWGGEEFLYILPGGLASAEVQAERVRAAVAAFPFGAPEFDLRLTVSIGATELQVIDSAGDLVERADRLLYQAKGQGRDRTIAGRVA
jgi:diguanylate cyclase (GGDEF)-like protein